MWNWGNAEQPTALGSPPGGPYHGDPLNFWALGDGVFANQNPCDPTKCQQAIATWEQNFLVYGLGRTLELGFPAQTLFDFIAVNIIGQLTTAGVDGHIIGIYRMPTCNASFAPFTTWAQVVAALLPGFNPAVDKQDPGDGQWAAAMDNWNHGYPNIAMGAASMLSQSTKVDWAKAWGWIRSNIKSVARDQAAMTTCFKWGLLPR